MCGINALVAQQCGYISIVSFGQHCTPGLHFVVELEIESSESCLKHFEIQYKGAGRYQKLVVLL